MIQLPEAFKEQIIDQIGEDNGLKLFATLDSQAPTSIRVNPFKVHAAPDLRSVGWSRYGFYLEQRPIFTLDPAFHAGNYYVQEAGSQFISHLLSGLDLEGKCVLDMCAAPGGKSTLYSTLVGLEGLVVANEINRQRAGVLAENAKKWGLGNIVVTNNDPSAVAQFSSWFDLVAVDAPCSGEGMFRKMPEAREEWTPQSVALCVKRQEDIMHEAWSSLKAGGIFIYSTCTFNRHENEQQLEAFAEWAGDELSSFEVVECDANWGVECSQVGEFQCFRFWPHMAEGEGFFAAIARKSFDAGGKSRMPKSKKSIFSTIDRPSLKELQRWISQPSLMEFYIVADRVYGYYSAKMNEIKRLAETLHVVHSGVVMGQIFKGSLKPDPSLAHFHDVSREALPWVELEKEDALNFLRKGELSAELFEEGLSLVCHEGSPLGFVKRVGRRVNNMYSNSLRILNY
ncbi:MAG: rRNA cytosine-C5-methylase [Rikenellaceae bacterium]